MFKNDSLDIMVLILESMTKEEITEWEAELLKENELNVLEYIAKLKLKMK